MGKKADEKFIDKLIKSEEKKETALKKQVDLFYENGERVDIISTSEKDPFLAIFATLRKNNTPQTLTEEQMMEKCVQIREYVNLGRRDNIEIDFQNMITRFDGFCYDLQVTLIRVLAMDGDRPIYLHILKSDILNSVIFIGGNDEQAFLKTKDAGGRDRVLRLSEINMLSFSNDSDPKKDIGLITDYSWMNAIICYSAMLGLNRSAVQNILSSEHMRNLYLEPQKSKDGAKKQTND